MSLMAYKTMKRVSVGFPPEIASKIEEMAQQMNNSFAGIVLYIVMQWLKQTEQRGGGINVQNLVGKTPDTMFRNFKKADMSELADAIKRGAKIMVRELPNGELLSLDEYLALKEKRSKEAR